ncbi:hypothetical protein B0H19DRAFT_1085060 [Mycena capillaripes]|nr:hypothetical protein B0H19DRAFT_1085060 [Mycena capillaripes]
MPRDSQKTRCPICNGRFKNGTTLKQHMNQPTGKCHPSLHPAIFKAAKNLRSQVPMQAQPNAQLDVMMDVDPMDIDEDYGYNVLGSNNPDDDDAPTSSINSRQEPVQPSMKPVKEYYKGATKTYGRGETFMDRFHQDQYSSERQTNLYYPFASAEEWEFASFIIRSNLTIAKTDELLQQRLTERMALSFHSAKDLRSRDRLPPGATLLGSVLSSDKTMLSSMTGGRQAHPVLISLADIDMDFRMKASHHAFMLFILCPIPKFIEKDAELKGVLESRIFHAVMDFVLEPLKKVAEIGMMMDDPLGWRRFCFTPIAGYIVDTPESALIAGVAGRTSSVTLASYKEFGDPFRHPPRTRDHTVGQLIKLEKKYRPWREFRAYVKAAKELRLNGVHRPFWVDWALADPSTFLTPEVLHHWHKFSYDHIIKWCIAALGAAEIDFRFSVLRPHTGMRHFKEGISKAKQATGREHRDIQRYLIAVVAEACGVSKDFLKAIASLLIFFYHGQAPEIAEDILSKMDAALACFHEKKQAIIDAGVRKGKQGPINNWWIPKLEFLSSVVPAIRANGATLQWSADITEHAHITEVKDPAYNSNNQGYETQICRHLDRRDKCIQFDLATAMDSAGVDLGVPALVDNDPEAILDDDAPLLLNRTSKLLEHIGPIARLSSSRAVVNYFADSNSLLAGEQPNAPLPYRTFTSGDGSTAFHLNRDYVGRRRTVQQVATTFGLPDFQDALQAYLQRPRDSRLVIGGKRPTGTIEDYLCGFTYLQVWHGVRIQSRSYHNSNQILVPETVNADPPSASWKYGRGDAVIVNTHSECKWPKSGLEGHVVCQLKLIFRLVPWQNHRPPTGIDRFLAYIERFDVVNQINPVTNNSGLFREPTTAMYQVKRARRANNSPMGDIIPLDRLRASVELTPRFGKVANKKLTCQNTFALCDNFWLNHFYTKELFWTLSD